MNIWKHTLLFCCAWLGLMGCQSTPDPIFRPATAEESPVSEDWPPSHRQVETFVRQGEDTPGVDYLYYRNAAGEYVRSVWLIGVEY